MHINELTEENQSTWRLQQHCEMCLMKEGDDFEDTVHFIQRLKACDKDTMSLESLSSGPFKVPNPEQLVAMIRHFIVTVYLFFFFFLGRVGKCVLHPNTKAPCVGLHQGTPLGLFAHWT